MSLDQPIYHLATATQWADALADGAYRVSTRGASLDEVGYIHASFLHQVATVAAFIYAGATEELVLLRIDPCRLAIAGVEVRVEQADPADARSEEFPHIYGPLPIDAVVCVEPARMRDAVLAVG